MTSRVHSIDSGCVMVVTDLHGDWDMYRRYRDYFLQLKNRGQLHTLVITGDYIHTEESAESDQSLAITLDLMRLKASLGPAIVILLGNHEMPHIYHIPLSRGTHVYTPRFEAALGEHRQDIIEFFKSLPLWVRTKAGVSICHAGAFAEVHDAPALDILFNFSHQTLLDNAADQLVESIRPSLRNRITADMGIPYADVVKHYLAVDGSENPRYDDYLLGAIATQHPNFDLLWSALFTSNEHQYGNRTYTQHVKGLLSSLTDGYHLQSVLVTGHIGCPNGYKVLANNRQLRIASGTHSYPNTSVKFLMFDAATPVPNARALVKGLSSPVI